MDIYSLVKFLHIASAIVWIGAGVGLVILGVAADRKSDREGFVRILQNVGFLAPRVFVPASLATLVLGIIAAWMNWGFVQLWVILGLVGFAATFLTGNFLLGPRAAKTEKIVAAEGASDHAVALGRELLTIAKFDYVMLFMVVADMVFKPAPGDFGVLAVMAIIIAGAAIAFLIPVFRAPRVAVAA
ncbi:MAG TPA: DUF2269 family protein [Bauldia sp.]|nr:DUF2269 family protein [Bauldia sp.]